MSRKNAENAEVDPPVVWWDKVPNPESGLQGPAQKQCQYWQYPPQLLKWACLSSASGAGVDHPWWEEVMVGQFHFPEDTLLVLQSAYCCLLFWSDLLYIFLSTREENWCWLSEAMSGGLLLTSDEILYACPKWEGSEGGHKVASMRMWRSLTSVLFCWGFEVLANLAVSNVTLTRHLTQVECKSITSTKFLQPAQGLKPNDRGILWYCASVACE